MPKLQILVSPKNGISWHRLINPMSYLDMGPDWTIELLWFGQDEHRIDCDVLWYSKYLVTDAKWIAKLKDKGTRIIVDIDDHWELYPQHPRYTDWKAANRDKQTLDNIKMADLVTCSTMRIQDVVRPYNKNTVVLPNAFPYGQPGYQPEETEPHDKMSFIYSGGSSHYNDVKMLEGRFRKLGSDGHVTKNARFLLAGYEPQMKKIYHSPADMKAGNNNYSILPSRGDWDKMATVFKHTNSYTILPSIDLDKYLTYYNLADVALIPLQDNSWNQYKSNLKILEASTRKLPVICSRVCPYTDDSIEPIMWVEKPSDWVDHIKWCIKNPQGVKDMGHKLAEYVWSTYNMSTVNETRKQVLNSIVK